MAVLFRYRAGGDKTAKGPVFSPPDFGIAEIVPTVDIRNVFVRKYRIGGIFFIAFSVSEGNALRLDSPFLSGRKELIGDAGIHEHMSPVGKTNRRA